LSAKPNTYLIGSNAYIRAYDADLDNATSVLSDICETLHQADFLVFDMRFDSLILPVDVQTDLVVMMEQLPELLNFFAKLPNYQYQVFALDMYEQGTETEIVFASNQYRTNIMVNNVKNRVRITVETHQINSMLIKLLYDFLGYAKTCCPKPTESPLFIDWLKGVRSASELL
jgi:hypothetical protein